MVSNICGLFGFVGKPSKDTWDTIKRLAILNEIRGKDSAGVAVISGKKPRLLKQAIPATEFFNKPEVADFCQTKQGEQFKIIIGHTRAATRGAVTTDNAHPFLRNSVIFAHNGMISNFDQLQVKYKTSYQVDSEIIGHVLDTYEKPEDALGKLSGYFVVPYVMRGRTDTLCLANHGGMLAFGQKGGQLYYSSNIYHLKDALDKRDFVISETVTDKLYRFYMLNGNIAISRQDFTAAVWKYIPPAQQQQTNFHKFHHGKKHKGRHNNTPYVSTPAYQPRRKLTDEEWEARHQERIKKWGENYFNTEEYWNEIISPDYNPSAYTPLRLTDGDPGDLIEGELLTN